MTICPSACREIGRTATTAHAGTRPKVRDDLAEDAGATVESRETVDRDFDGNWRYVMQ